MKSFRIVCQWNRLTYSWKIKDCRVRFMGTKSNIYKWRNKWQILKTFHLHRMYLLGQGSYMEKPKHMRWMQLVHFDLSHQKHHGKILMTSMHTHEKIRLEIWSQFFAPGQVKKILRTSKNFQQPKKQHPEIFFWLIKRKEQFSLHLCISKKQIS